LITNIKLRLAISIAIGSIFVCIEPAYAIDGKSTIDFINADPGYNVLDPEDHKKEVDPGDIASTTGPLRIDYVPSFTFGDTRITKNTMVSKADAQLLHNGDGPRANFIQVSDYRNTGTGWSLLVRQEHQFRNDTQAKAILKGAVLSFDKAWSGSSFDQSLAPNVSKDTIVMNNIGDTYPLATAEAGKGQGTWSISFGASETNPLGKETTLSPKMDQQNHAELDGSFENQPKYRNDAIQLTIPASTTIQAGKYSTVLTWIIAELP